MNEDEREQLTGDQAPEDENAWQPIGTTKGEGQLIGEGQVFMAPLGTPLPPRDAKQAFAYMAEQDEQGHHESINVTDLPPVVQDALTALADHIGRRQVAFSRMQSAYERAHEKKRQAWREARQEVENVRAAYSSTSGQQREADLRASLEKAQAEANSAKAARDNATLKAMQAREDVKRVSAELRDVREKAAEGARWKRQAEHNLSEMNKLIIEREAVRDNLTAMRDNCTSLGEQRDYWYTASNEYKAKLGDAEIDLATVQEENKRRGERINEVTAELGRAQNRILELEQAEPPEGLAAGLGEQLRAVQRHNNGLQKENETLRAALQAIKDAADLAQPGGSGE